MFVVEINNRFKTMNFLQALGRATVKEHFRNRPDDFNDYLDMLVADQPTEPETPVEDDDAVNEDIAVTPKEETTETKQ